MQEVKEQEAGKDRCLVKEDNPYFCPGIITFLFDTYLAIFPLWSGLLLGDLSRYESHEEDLVTTKKQPKTRDTNCHVEKWFVIVKHSIMEKGKRNKPQTFIRKMHQSLKGRYTESIIQHNLPLKLLLQPEPLETPVNLDQSQETWMKKNQERFPSTKSKFYSVPQKIPVPKKRRLDVTQSKKRSSCHTSQLPAKVLPVDEEVMKSLVQNRKICIAYMKACYYVLYELHVIIGRHAMEEGTYRADCSNFEVSQAEE